MGENDELNELQTLKTLLLPEVNIDLVNAALKLEKRLETIEELIKIQSGHGNWDYDPYMHGMLNGMIVIQGCITGKQAEFVNAPEKWLIDSPEKHTISAEYPDEVQGCLHNLCPECNGTGKNKKTGAACVHYLSCRCSKCMPFTMGKNK